MIDISGVVEWLNSEIPRLQSEHDIPGVAVGICDRSGRVWSAGFGVKSKDNGDPVTTRTLFSIQSGSKMYTATAVMLAVRKGIVRLDEPLTSYLPDFTVGSRWESNPAQRMTLRNLLAHKAGFTHEAPLGSNVDDRDTNFDEHCSSISDTWLRFPVGHHYEYSNLGIDLAAYVVQQVSGVTFHEFVRRELLAPLGLDRTTFDPEVIVADSDRATGYSRWIDTLPVRVPMVGAGGAYTCVDDALRYLQLHLAGGFGLLERPLLDEMYQIPDPLPGQSFGYGLGVDISRWNGRRVLNHSGGGFGFQSDLAWDPAAGIGVAVLTNSEDHPLLVQFAARILRGLTGADSLKPELPPAYAPSPSPEALQLLTGDYVGRGGSVATIVLDGSRLVIVREGVEAPLRSVGQRDVVVESDGHHRFCFSGDDRNGAPRYLINADNGQAYYRNDVPVDIDGGSVESYSIDYLGKRIGNIRLRRRGQVATCEGTRGSVPFPPLRLTEDAPGLYFCSMGEALDLRTERPTYANIPLRPDLSTPDTAGSHDGRD